jgi:excisionase family DNA binding protein
MERPMTVRELAAMLKCNPSFVYREANAGNIPAFRLGSLWRFDHGAIRAWMAALTKQQAASVRCEKRLDLPDAPDNKPVKVAQPDGVGAAVLHYLSNQDPLAKLVG